MLKMEAVARCGRYVTGHNNPGGYVSVSRQESNGHAVYGNLVTCGSVWHCPVCAAKIAERRREEIVTLLKGQVERGAVVYMVAFTVPHHLRQPCKMLRDTVALAFKRMQGGAEWKRQKAKAGFVGSIRALETTYGDNGWHPHIHALFVFDRDDPKAAEAFGDWMFLTWARIVAQMGLGKCNPAVWKFEKARRVIDAGSYVVKELTHGRSKHAKGAGRTPWQIIEDIVDGKDHGGVPAADIERDIWLFREYADAFKGARQLTWSKGFRHSAETDQEAADAQEPSRKVLFFTREGWLRVQELRLQTAVLDAAEHFDGYELVTCIEKMGVGKSGMFPAWAVHAETFKAETI